MSLLNEIKSQRAALPPRIIVHGPEKIGKTTFFGGGTYEGAAHPGADSAVFIQTEDGLTGSYANAFPLARSIDDVYAAIGALMQEEHQYKAVIIDSLDWLERLVFQRTIDLSPEKVAEINGTRQKATPVTMEVAHGGYGKAYGVALKLWSQILDGLNSLRAKGMLIGMISHSKVVEFNDPTTEPYDRYELKLHSPRRNVGINDVTMEWADIIGFANRSVFVSNVGDDKKKVNRAATGANAPRMLFVNGQPGFVAGNRFGMQDVPLQWSAFLDEYVRCIQQ